MPSLTHICPPGPEGQSSVHFYVTTHFGCLLCLPVAHITLRCTARSGLCSFGFLVLRDEAPLPEQHHADRTNFAEAKCVHNIRVCVYVYIWSNG